MSFGGMIKAALLLMWVPVSLTISLIVFLARVVPSWVQEMRAKNARSIRMRRWAHHRAKGLIRSTKGWGGGSRRRLLSERGQFLPLLFEISSLISKRMCSSFSKPCRISEDLLSR